MVAADHLREVLPSLQERLESFASEALPQVRTHERSLSRMERAGGDLDASWSQSWLGYHASLYFKDFERPPMGQMFSVRRDYDGPDLPEVYAYLQDRVEEADRLRTEIATELSVLRGRPNFAAEVTLLDELENLTWGQSPRVFIGRMGPPSSQISHDMVALNQGSQTPPHLQILAEIRAAATRAAAITAFSSQALRLLRQVGLRSGTSRTKAVTSATEDARSVPDSIRQSLQRFQRDHPDPRRAAFLMMKFGTTDAHKAMVKAVRDALTENGIVALRADDRQYHEEVYANICTYMHGCGLGVAIFERLEADEFNPNVSLEVGYMLALGKRVCFLKDKTLKGLHADIVGHLYRSFDTQRPSETISAQVGAWLRDWELVP